MDVKFFVIGFLVFVLGVFLMTRHKFYRYKTNDMLFPASFRAFLGAALIMLFGLVVMIIEVKKGINF